jgi:hypothetical protein
VKRLFVVVVAVFLDNTKCSSGQWDPHLQIRMCSKHRFFFSPEKSICLVDFFCFAIELFFVWIQLSCNTCIFLKILSQQAIELSTKMRLNRRQWLLCFCWNWRKTRSFHVFEHRNDGKTNYVKNSHQHTNSIWRSVINELLRKHRSRHYNA